MTGCFKRNSQSLTHILYQEPTITAFLLNLTNPNKDAIVNLIDGLSVCQLCVYACVHKKCSHQHKCKWTLWQVRERHNMEQRKRNKLHPFSIIISSLSFVEAASAASANGVLTWQANHCICSDHHQFIDCSIWPLFSDAQAVVILLQQFSGCKYVIRQHHTDYMLCYWGKPFLWVFPHRLERCVYHCIPTTKCWAF